MYVFSFMYALCVRVSTEARREDLQKSPCRCLESNPCPLQVQQVLLTFEVVHCVAGTGCFPPGCHDVTGPTVHAQLSGISRLQKWPPWKVWCKLKGGLSPGLSGKYLTMLYRSQKPSPGNTQNSGSRTNPERGQSHLCP